MMVLSLEVDQDLAVLLKISRQNKHLAASNFKYSFVSVRRLSSFGFPK